VQDVHGTVIWQKLSHFSKVVRQQSFILRIVGLRGLEREPLLSRLMFYFHELVKKIFCFDQKSFSLLPFIQEP
jgi:hypothetical protein